MASSTGKSSAIAAGITRQFTILRLALPVVPSTAVMTGNLTNTVLSAVDTFSQNHLLMAGDAIPMGLSEIRK